MAIEGIKEKDDLLKKELQRYQEITGINVSVHSPGDGNEKVPSFEDKYGANNVFDAAKNAPVFNNNASAAASANGIGNQTGENPNWNLYDAVINGGTNQTVEVGGVNAQQGVPTATPTGLPQSSGSGYNNPQGGATNKPNAGNPNIDTNNKPGFESVINSMAYTPKPSESNRFTDSVPPNGEGMVQPEPKVGPNDTKGPNESVGPNETAGVNDTNGPNETSDTEPPVDNNKPPETSTEIDQQEQKKLHEQQEEAALKKQQEEQKPAA